MTPDAAQALALDAKALSGLRRDAHANPREAASRVAGQFEALFLQQVLKQMRETLPKDGPFDSDTMRTYTSLFDQQIAQHLSARGLGLKEAIERQLARALPDAVPATSAPAPASADQAKAAMQRLGATPPPPLPSHTRAAEMKPVASVAHSVQAFVEKLRPHAEAAARTTGIPAHLLIAQAGLETGWGRSQPRSADGAVSHNLFGVKAGARWQGASVAAATTEFVQGTMLRTVERFRSYGSLTEAFRDFAQVLAGNRYAEARASARANDADGYARNLQRAGYATDPAYADKLGRAIRMVTQHLASAPAPSVTSAAPALPPDGPQVFAQRADIPERPTRTLTARL